MKRILAFMMALLLITSFIACASKQDSTPDNTNDTALDTADASTSAVANGSDRLAKIKEQGYIEVCTEPYFAPYEFVDSTKTGDEQYVGLDMEIARQIAADLGVDLKIVPLEFSAVLAGITDGKYDLAISCIAYSPERAENMAMSNGYFFLNDGYGLLVREEDKDKYNTLEDTKDAVFATQSGSVMEAIYNQYVTESADLKVFGTMTDAYLAVSEGKADVCIVGAATGESYAQANGGLAVAAYRFPSDESLTGFRVAATLEGTDSLIEAVNETIAKLREEGKPEQWFDEYTAYAKSLGIE